LELGAGRIPQMEYFAENEGASEFAEAMASMNGEKVLVFEPATVKLEGGDDGK
jgi:plastocyanin